MFKQSKIANDELWLIHCLRFSFASMMVCCYLSAFRKWCQAPCLWCLWVLPSVEAVVKGDFQCGGIQQIWMLSICAIYITSRWEECKISQHLARIWFILMQLDAPCHASAFFSISSTGLALTKKRLPQKNRGTCGLEATKTRAIENLPAHQNCKGKVSYFSGWLKAPRTLAVWHCHLRLRSSSLWIS